MENKLLELADQLEEQGRALLAQARQLQQLAGQAAERAGEASPAGSGTERFSRAPSERSTGESRRTSAARGERTPRTPRPSGSEDRPRRSGGRRTGGSGAPEWTPKSNRGKR